MVRCFKDDNITHVEGSIDPLRDIEIIETELLIRDIDSIEKRIQKSSKKAKWVSSSVVNFSFSNLELIVPSFKKIKFWYLLLK